jgi:glycolate oxidase FAD binding subunit
VRDVEVFHDRPGDVWRISVKPSDGPAAVASLGADAVLLDWGGGLIWALAPEGTDLRARLDGLAGHATLVRASAETRARIPALHPEPAPVEALAEGLRRRFDPRGILAGAG